MTPLIECTLAAFIIVLIILFVILTIFIVKFLKETTQTMTSIKELTDLTKEELKPALESINKILSTINNVSTATNRQLDMIKKILTTLLGASCVAFGSIKDKGGFFNGLVSGFNFFRKKRR